MKSILDWLAMLCFVLILEFSPAQSFDNIRDPFVESSVAKTTPGPSVGKEELFIYDVNNRCSKSLAGIINNLYPDVAIAAEQEAEQLIIKTTPLWYKNILPQLRKIDGPLEQILIEVRVIELNENSLGELGVSWAFSQDGIAISEAQRTMDLINCISLLVADGKASILANPRITALVGKEALIHIGDKLPYSLPVENSSGKVTWEIKYLDSGVNLKIQPQKSEKDYIALHLQPEVSSIKQWKQTPAGEYPVISTRQVDTYLRLKEGETFALGGLLNTEERENTQKIPILGDIPVLNIFFKITTQEKIKSDVIFLVTAKKL